MASSSPSTVTMFKLVTQLVCILLHAIVHVQALGKPVLHPADVYIEYIGSIYMDPLCSVIEEETVQHIQAIKWTLSKLNENDYIPRVKIGLRVSETCKKDGEASRLGLNLATEMSNEAEARIVGIIGPDYSSESESISRLLSSLPEEYRLLQLGYSATSSSLSNRRIYKNFFRTIPPDDIQVEVMIDYMEALNWTYMAIIYDDDAYGNGGKDQLLTKLEGRDICFPTLIPVDTSYRQISKLETDIRDKIINRDIPISGILVFGSSTLAQYVLTATENVIQKTPNVSRPVFLFSEASAYIQWQFTNISKGSFVLSPPRRIISNFQQEWKSIFTDTERLYQELESNSWIRDVYKVKFNCQLAATKEENTCPQITASEFEERVPDSVYNQYAIQAAMVIANVVRNVYRKTCPDMTGLCAEFLSSNNTPREEFIKELTEITEINFDSFGNFRQVEFQNPDLVIYFGNSSDAILPRSSPLYEVYSHKICSFVPSTSCLVKVADYKISKELQIMFEDIKDYGINDEELSWPNIREAQCPDGSVCSECLKEYVEESIFYIPGDLYIVGTAPVHNKGSTPLQCSGLKKGGLDIVETIRFAVNEAKSKPSAKIGIIIIDSCNDPQIIQEKILTLHRLGVYINGTYNYVGDKILGYIGGWSSDVSKAVAEITSRLGYPQISYGSTAPVLSERSLYPYFLRVPSSDEKQAETILKIIEELGGNFIQLLHSASAYGEGGRDLIMSLIDSSAFEFCVAQVMPISRTSDKNAVLTRIRKFPQAKIVILFLGSFEIEHMFDAFNSLNKNEFLFISSEGWGTRYDVDRFLNLIGSITVTSQLTINEKLKDHIKNLRPVKLSVDPWIRSYLEFQFDCYFEWSYNKISKKMCHGKESLDVYTTSFRLDAWTPFAERAVTSILSGTKSVLSDKCNGITTVICDQYRNSPQEVYEAVKSVRLRSNSGFDMRIFNDNGDGTAGYQIYVVANDQDGQYKRVGGSSLGADSEEFVLTFQTSLFHSVWGATLNSSCSANIPKFMQCFPPSTPPPSTDLSVGVIVVIVILGVVCCVLAGILLFMCYRHGCCIRLDNGRLKITTPYLTPIYNKERNTHRAEGKDSHVQEENYASIPADSYNISLEYPNTQQTTDKSASSSERIMSDRSSMSESQDSRTAGSARRMICRDNLAFENDAGVVNVGGLSNQSSSSGYGSNVMSDRNVKSESAAPSRIIDIVYQADGSYITATADLKNKISRESGIGMSPGTMQPDKYGEKSSSMQVNNENHL